MKERDSKKLAARLPAGERREATVAAVVELAARQNPGTITTAAIAEHMGLTQGALFRHFASKDLVFQAVMSWVSDRMLAWVDRAVTATESSGAALEAIFQSHINFVSEHPGVPRMLFGELQRPEDTLTKRKVRALVGNYGKRLRQLLDAGKAKGELDPELDVKAAAGLFIGTIQGIIIQSLLTGDARHIRREAPKAFAIYCRGIRISS